MSNWHRPEFSISGYNAARFGNNRFSALQMTELGHFQSLFNQLKTYQAQPRLFHSQPLKDEFVSFAMQLSNNN